MAIFAPRILTVDAGSLVQVVLNEQTSKSLCSVQCCNIASNSLGVGLKHTYVLNDAFDSNQFK